MKIIGVINHLSHPVANETINHFVDRLGYTSIATAVSIKAGEVADIIPQDESFGLSDLALIVSICVGITVVIKNVYEMIIMRRNQKKDRSD